MALEKRYLGFLRIRLVAHRLALPVFRPGLFCFADLAKQIIFLFLKLAVAGLQGLRAICGGLLCRYCRIVLSGGGLLLLLRFVLLLLICGIIGGLFGRI